MAEYYAVLSKAVAGLENNGADTRRAVYDKARNALIGQLKAIEPPLPTAEISRQRLELEEAIRRVEREAAATGKSQSARAAAAPRSNVAAARTSAARAPKPSPQDVFRRAIQEAESVPDQAPPTEREPVAARADDWSVDDANAEAAGHVEPPSAPAPAPQSRAVRPAPRPAAALPARKTETYLPSQGYVEEQPRPDEPRLAPDYDYEWDPDSSPRAASSNGAREPVPEVGAVDRSGRMQGQRRLRPRADDDVDVLERRARPSALPAVLLVVLIVVMLVGLAALGWSQRAIIADLLGGFDSHQAAPQSAAAAAPDASTKDSDSLLGNSQAAGDSSSAPADDSVRVVTPGAPQADNAAPAAPAAQAPMAPAAPAAAPSDNGSALVAQKATLYEEPLDQSAAQNGVVAIKAAVTWSAVQASEGQEIVGSIDIPDRGMKIKLTIRQNHDKTLPASHVVEVVVQAPSNFPGKGIRDVPRIVMKPAEEGRGQPLIGASAKVADGFFWVALSSDDADVSANLNLMKQNEWIDLPLLYETGQRAIVTIEKGTAGDRVFDQVLSAWATSG